MLCGHKAHEQRTTGQPDSNHVPISLPTPRRQVPPRAAGHGWEGDVPPEGLGGRSSWVCGGSPTGGSRASKAEGLKYQQTPTPTSCSGDSQKHLSPGGQHLCTELGREKLRRLEVHLGCVWTPAVLPSWDSAAAALGGPAGLSAQGWEGQQTEKSRVRTAWVQRTNMMQLAPP